MDRDTPAAGGLWRLVGIAFGVGALAVGSYGRLDRTRDPVAVVRELTGRYPMLDVEIPVDRLGPRCDGADAEACTELGLAVAEVRRADEVPVPRCLEQALYVRGCDGGHWQGCDLAMKDDGSCPAPQLERARAVLQFDYDRMVFAACDALGRLRPR